MLYLKTGQEVPKEWKQYIELDDGLKGYVIDNICTLVPTEEYLKYRMEELHPDIIELLKKAFFEKDKLIYHSRIDTIIILQEYCLEKAKRYIGYMWLGTHSYLDVFGTKATAYFENIIEEQKEAEKKEQLDRMEKQMEDMQEQLWEMQKLLLNMAKQQNTDFYKKIAK